MRIILKNNLKCFNKNQGNYLSREYQQHFYRLLQKFEANLEVQLPAKHLKDFEESKNFDKSNKLLSYVFHLTTLAL